MHTAQEALLQLTGRQKHLWNDFAESFPSENELVAAALSLNAKLVQPWCDAETALVASVASTQRLSRKKLALDLHSASG